METDLMDHSPPRQPPMRASQGSAGSLGGLLDAVRQDYANQGMLRAAAMSGLQRTPQSSGQRARLQQQAELASSPGAAVAATQQAVQGARAAAASAAVAAAAGSLLSPARQQLARHQAQATAGGAAAAAAASSSMQRVLDAAHTGLMDLKLSSIMPSVDELIHLPVDSLAVVVSGGGRWGWAEGARGGGGGR